MHKFLIIINEQRPRGQSRQWFIDIVILNLDKCTLGFILKENEDRGRWHKMVETIIWPWMGHKYLKKIKYLSQSKTYMYLTW